MSKWNVWMECNGQNYLYGSYNNQRYANELAMWLRGVRGVETFVEESGENNSDGHKQ